MLANILKYFLQGALIGVVFLKNMEPVWHLKVTNQTLLQICDNLVSKPHPLAETQLPVVLACMQQSIKL